MMATCDVHFYAHQQNKAFGMKVPIPPPDAGHVLHQYLRQHYAYAVEDGLAEDVELVVKRDSNGCVVEEVGELSADYSYTVEVGTVLGGGAPPQGNYWTSSNFGDICFQIGIEWQHAALHEQKRMSARIPFRCSFFRKPPMAEDLPVPLKPSYTVDRVLAEPVARFIQAQHSPHCVLNLDHGVEPAPTDFEKKLEDMNEYGSAFEIDGIVDGCRLVLIAEPCYFCEQQGPPRKTWRLVGYALDNLRGEIEQKRAELETVAVAPVAAAAAAAVTCKRLSLVLDIDQTFANAFANEGKKARYKIARTTKVYANELADPMSADGEPEIGTLEAGATVEVIEIIPQIAKSTAQRPAEGSKAVHYRKATWFVDGDTGVLFYFEIRANLREFLERMQDKYVVYFLSAGSSTYVQAIGDAMAVWANSVGLPSSLLTADRFFSSRLNRRTNFGGREGIVKLQRFKSGPAVPTRDSHTDGQDHGTKFLEHALFWAAASSTAQVAIVDDKHQVWAPDLQKQVWIIKAQERKEGDKRLGAQAQSQAFYDEDDCDDQGRPKMKIGTSLQIKADDLEAAYKMVALGGCSSMGEAQAAMNAKKVKDMQAKQHAKSKAHHHPKRALSPEGAPTGQSSRPRHGPSQSPSRAAAGARQPPPRRAPGWETKWGDTHKKWFYFNQITKQHSWEFPVALPAVRHVFVDWSNVRITAEKDKLSIDVKKLMAVLEEAGVDRSIDRVQTEGHSPADNTNYSFLVCGMSWEEATPTSAEIRHHKAFLDLGFNMKDPEIRAHNNGKEKYTDGVLHEAISALLDNAKRSQNCRPPQPGPPQVLVLVTGDGNLNGSDSTFPDKCEKAIRQGYMVEVWAWRTACSRVYKDMEAAHPTNMKVRYLDDIKGKFTTGKRWGGSSGSPEPGSPSRFRGGGARSRSPI